MARKSSSKRRSSSRRKSAKKGSLHADRGTRPPRRKPSVSMAKRKRSARKKARTRRSVRVRA